MSRRGMNIYKRKDGRWEGRFEKGRRENGRLWYGYVYANTYKEVKEKKERARRDWAQRKAEEIRSAGTFSGVAASWLDEKSATVKPSTLCKYRNLLSDYILPSLGTKEFSEITTGDISSLIRELSERGGKDGKGLSASTLSAVLRLINALRKYVIKRNGRASFCTEEINIHRSAKPMRVFNSAEQSKIFEYLTDHPGCTTLGILICMLSGLRIGELCALKWSDIDLEKRLICVTRTMQRIQINGQRSKTMIHIGRAKTANSVRSIPIMEELIPILKQFYVENAYVLTGREDKFLEPRCLQYKFKRILRSCHIDDAGFHTIRHTFATRCVETGFDIKTLSRILGHSNISTTMNLYVHPSEEHMRRSMEKLSRLFFTVKPSDRSSSIPENINKISAFA